MRRPTSAMWLSLVVAVLTLPACSLLNHPAALPAPPSDAGVTDAEGLDAGDAGDGGNVDGGPVCRAREVCFNGPSVDDDCDEATDCADLDCANAAACCDDGTGAALFTENWGAATFEVNWSFAAADMASTFTLSDGALTSFNADGRVRSLMPSDGARRCVPLALGARIEVVLDATRCSTIACTDEAAVLLTGADSPASGVALAADLRVGAGHDGALRVTSGSTSLLPVAASLAVGGRVVIEISPSARDGVAVLAARVLTGAVGSEAVVVADGAFIAQSLLRACPGGPGLAIAVEGRGSTVTVGRLSVTPLACTNPRLFMAGGNVVTTANVGASDGWTSGGIAAPALLPEMDIEHLFYDATNVERDLESIAPIDFAIGAADGASFTATWNPLLGSDGVVGHAYVGTTPPACTTPPCTPGRSVREPTASANYLDDVIDGTTHVLAFARESAASSDVFAIEYVDAPVRNDQPVTVLPSMLVEPSTDCSSVRDPALAQAGAVPSDGLWLFYTCERGAEESTIRAVALELTAGVLGPISGTDVEVIAPGIGVYAEGGVESPAALVRVREMSLPEFPERILAVRLWFVARGRDGRRSLALAEGQIGVPAPSAPASTPIPVLAPYAANPLMYGDAAVLGACDGDCDVRDVGIGRLPSETVLTVLVARRVDRTAGGTEWQLVPLVQTLEARWWGIP